MNPILEFLQSELPALLALSATGLIYAGEHRVHRYNYAYLKMVGGEELIPERMQRYYMSVAFFPWLAYLSSLLLSTAWPIVKFQIVGLALIIVCFAVRLWSMRSLGRLWSQRCIYIAGMPRVTEGAFRVFRYPEYTARLFEGLGFVLFFGLNPISIVLWLRSAMLLVPIIKVESRQLSELSVAPLQLETESSTVGTSKSYKV